jgi:hypothetical protein
MNKKQTLENYFQALIGILSDVYIILCIAKNTSDTVVFVGDLHVEPICRFYTYTNLIKHMEVYKKPEGSEDYLDYDKKQEIHGS